jgi:enterochelin esterase family protein
VKSPKHRQSNRRNLNTFSYIGGFSGSNSPFGPAFNAKTDYNGAFSDPAGFEKKVHLLWVGIGTDEPKNMYAGVHAFHNALTQAGIQHVYYESPGTSHEWLTWRRDLHGFLPRLFTAAAK